MTKVVLKKSEVLKSARPLIVEPLLNRKGEGVDSKTSSTKPSTEELLQVLNGEESFSPAQFSYSSSPEETPESPSHNKDSELAVQEAESQAEEILDKARKDADEIVEKAHSQKESILSEARTQAEEIQEAANKASSQVKEQAVAEGMEEGYKKSEEENKRLVALLQKVSSQIVDEKGKILETVESSIVELILMIASKVVKSITSQYKQVVYDNVVAAIEKLKIRNDLIVRVNPEDLYTMEQHKANLLQEINGIENIQFLEDPTIEQGGCIIKSDFGSIDGKISSQLAEIEEQIRKVSPIKPL